MKLLRRLSYAALAFGFLHIVFGAIVRISGSGLGCGDHWPKCHGWWIPPLRRMDLIIEVSHRYLAAGLTTTVLLLLAGALLKRREPGVSGEGGVLRPAVLAAVLVVSAALLGAVVVKMELHNKYIIVLHLAIAMSLLATVAVSTVRAGGLGSLAATPGGASDKTFRSAAAAAGLAFIAVAFGGLTANVVGANGACQGFPTCNQGVLTHGAPLWVHAIHRVIAFALLFHTLGMAIAVVRRGESLLIRRAARIVFGTVVLQIVVAAALVSLHLPAPLRSLHEAVGTLVWLTAFVFAVLARRASVDGDPALLEPVRPTAPERPLGRPVPAIPMTATTPHASATEVSVGGAATAMAVADATTSDVTVHANETFERTSFAAPLEPSYAAIDRDDVATPEEIGPAPVAAIEPIVSSEAEPFAVEFEIVEHDVIEPAIVSLAAVSPSVALEVEVGTIVDEVPDAGVHATAEVATPVAVEAPPTAAEWIDDVPQPTAAPAMEIEATLAEASAPVDAPADEPHEVRAVVETVDLIADEPMRPEWSAAVEAAPAAIVVEEATAAEIPVDALEAEPVRVMIEEAPTHDEPAPVEGLASAADVGVAVEVEAVAAEVEPAPVAAAAPAAPFVVAEADAPTAEAVAVADGPAPVAVEPELELSAPNETPPNEATPNEAPPHELVLPDESMPAELAPVAAEDVAAEPIESEPVIAEADDWTDAPVAEEPWAAAPFEPEAAVAEPFAAASDDVELDDEGAPDEGVLVARGDAAPRAYSALLEPPSLEEIDADEALADAPWLADAFAIEAEELEWEARQQAPVLRRIEVEPAAAPVAPAPAAASLASVADAVARRRTRPPTLAVLIARGADF